HRRATRHLAGRAGRHGRAQRRTRLRMVSARPGGRPSRSDGRATRRSRDLGQNFLRDPNILGVIGRESELSARDVVLEVGGGEGVLSAYLAPLVNWVHVVEIDERLRPTLEDRLGGFENVALWWCDAPRPARDGTQADQDGREPALWNRRGSAPAHDRGVGRHPDVGGHGAARGRRTAGRGSGKRYLRCELRPGATGGSGKGGQGDT